MKIVCVIRYQIDPFQREAFKDLCGELGPNHTAMRGPLGGIFPAVRRHKRYRVGIDRIRKPGGV